METGIIRATEYVALPFPAAGRPAKPMIEDKAALFEHVADTGSIDLEVGTKDADAFVICVRFLAALAARAAIR